MLPPYYAASFGRAGSDRSFYAAYVLQHCKAAMASQGKTNFYMVSWQRNTLSS